MKQIDFLVCVRCFTFNHAPYIKDAMDGFCMQKTSFPFVCVIVDDASTDGEQDVIKSYLAQYFNFDNQEIVRNEETNDYVLTFAQHKTNKNCFFAVYFLKYNHYSVKKNKFPYFSEYHDNAKYIALCEGDDYWIHPQKLQLQTDYLKKNANCILCYGSGKSYIQSSHSFEKTIKGKDFVTFEKLLFANPVLTMTTMMRFTAFDRFIKDEKTWNKKAWKMGDYPMWLWCSANGDCHYFDEIFGVYRVLEESASHTLDKEKRLAFFLDFKDIQLFFAKKYNASSKVRYLMLARDEFTMFKLLYYSSKFKAIKCLFRIPYYVLRSLCER